jgi:hypothetical protein
VKTRLILRLKIFACLSTKNKDCSSSLCFQGSRLKVFFLFYEKFCYKMRQKHLTKDVGSIENIETLVLQIWLLNVAAFFLFHRRSSQTHWSKSYEHSVS